MYMMNMCCFDCFQVVKEGLVVRVFDEYQVVRYFVEDDLEFFYVFDKDDDYSEFEDLVCKEFKQLGFEIFQNVVVFFIFNVFG